MKDYTVVSIDFRQAKEWFLKMHYAKRPPHSIYCFGLYNESVLVGVCNFGHPLASQLQNACPGFRTVELNRLITTDKSENVLSFFVAKCLSMIPNKTVVVSYADTKMGHTGAIYQATNWIYTGLSAGGNVWALKGKENMHHTSIEDSVGRYDNENITTKTKAELLKDKYGELLYRKAESKKHRYFYLKGSRKQRKQMIRLFKYSSEPYPKSDKTKYDILIAPSVQLRLI